MKTKTILLKLALCPGNSGASEVCTECSYRGCSEGCTTALKKDALLLLSETESSAEKQPKVALKSQVTTLLREIGVPAHIKGYQYLREAIIIAVGNPEAVNSITKVLYPQVAKTFRSTPSRVERAIRHAIERAWDRGDMDILIKHFGNTTDSSKGKTTNSEFISTLADEISLNHDPVEA